MNVRPVVTAEDHAAALREIERLWGAGPGTPEGSLLDVLVTLVEHYESKRYPVEDADPVEVIKVYMEMTGRTQRDLSALLGSPSRSDMTQRRFSSLHKKNARPKPCSLNASDLLSV